MGDIQASNDSRQRHSTEMIACGRAAGLPNDKKNGRTRRPFFWKPGTNQCPEASFLASLALLAAAFAASAALLAMLAALDAASLAWPTTEELLAGADEAAEAACCA